MLLGLITLLTALCISGIAAYYSIVGLTAIFAAAVFPVILMGSVLEVGKVITTLWLHYNWERAPWKIKTYLVSAVGILMLITSMGIFGFLSKAHLEQAVPSGDVQAQVQLFDEKIKTQRDNIDSARKALVQMDSAVDQTLVRTTDENGATKSANLRRSQQKERGRLQQDIDNAQKAIAKLQEERAPIASQFRKVEAEVGPIKYIAALIYGENTDQNMLEAAVRWVIIIIVAVFDPLAIILLLAATTSIDWSKIDRSKKKEDELQVVREAAELEALKLANLQAENDRLHGEEQVAILLANVKETTRKETEAEFIEALEKEQSTIIELEAAVAEEQAKLTEFNQMVHSQSQRVEEFNAYAAEIESQFDQAINDKAATDSKIADLTIKVDELTTTLTDVSTEANNLKEKYLATQSDNEGVKEQLQALAAQHSEIVDLKEELAAQLSNEVALTTELAESIKTLEDIIAAKLLKEEQLTKELEEAKAALEAAAAEELEPLEFVLPEHEPFEPTVLTDYLSPENWERSFPEIEPVIEEVPLASAALDTTELKEDTGAVFSNDPDGNYVEGFVEEQPPSGTLTDPRIAKLAFEAVFADRPEYFAPKVEEPIVEPVVEETPLPTLPVDDFAAEIVKDAALVEVAPVESMPTLPVTPTKKRPLPKMAASPDNFPLGGNASFGTKFPENPIKGDLFLRVDYMPSKLFKWVGSRWIEMDKSISDTYAYDLEYIKLLADKVGTGEYDIDDLSDIEQDQLAEYLQNTK